MTTTTMRPSSLRWRWLVASLLVLMGAVLIGIAAGPASLSVGEIVGSIADRLPGVEVDTGLTERQEAILWQLRMPRVALGVLVGAMLAGAGGAFQGVFRNPLADPYLLGVAAGAGLGATIAFAYGPDTSTWTIDPLPVLAFVGGLTGVVLAYLLGYSVRVGRTAVTLILAGVAVAAFLTATQTFIQQRQSQTLREIYTWILGRLTTVGWEEVMLLLPYVAACCAVILAGRRLLDVMAVGDDESAALGIDPAKVRATIIVAATLGTAAAVAVSGLIAFVGIIVPHTVRLLTGSSYRIVLPLSLILGAAFLVLADVLARTLVSPGELPIGVVTAFVGAPFFAVVLKTSRGVAA